MSVYLSEDAQKLELDVNFSTETSLGSWNYGGNPISRLVLIEDVGTRIK